MKIICKIIDDSVKLSKISFTIDLAFEGLVHLKLQFKLQFNFGTHQFEGW